MKKYKKVIPIIIAFIIGISTTVTAATVFNSKDITYSSSSTTKKNVKDSLDELYTKVNTPWKCAEGYKCIELKPISSVKIGDYISMTPTATSYTISKDLTGYDSDQTINPSELNVWRVIRKNDDGTVDMVSDKVSSTSVHFSGQTGYVNFIKSLNTIAAQYTDRIHVQSTRHMGYSNQIETCTTFSSSACPSDTGYKTDLELVNVAYGGSASCTRDCTVLIGKDSSGKSTTYWLASRYVLSDSNVYYRGRNVYATGNLLHTNMFRSDGTVYDYGQAVRPIITLKSTSEIESGSGTSSSPYVLD